MPPPPSYIDITSFPFTRTITIAEHNGGTFGGVANEVWLRIVTTDIMAIGIIVPTVSGTNFAATWFKSDGSTNFGGVGPGDVGGWKLLAAGQTYYIRVRKSPTGAVATNYSFEAESADLSPTINNDTIIVNDDTIWASAAPFGNQAIPATLWNIRTGAFVGIALDVPAGEALDFLPSRYGLIHHRFKSSAPRLRLVDNNLATVTEVDTSPAIGSVLPIIVSNGTNFYVCNRSNNQVYRVTQSGVITLIATIDSLGNWIHAIGVARDESIIYYTLGTTANGGALADIKKWNVATNTAAGTFYSVAEFPADSGGWVSAINNNPGRAYQLKDGSLVAYYQNFTDSKTVLLHINSAGTLINAYTYNYATISLNHISQSPSDPDRIFAWFYVNNNGDLARFGDLVLATNVLADSFDKDHFSAGLNMDTDASLKFGPSNSCVFASLGLAGSAPPTTGSIQVDKVTIGGDLTVFQFSTTGLSPGTFSLSNGGQQLFLTLTPGTYAIEEILPAGWTNSVVVSNGSPISAITVTAGETVTVTFVNIPEDTSSGQGGIYEVVWGKRNDTLWVDIGAETTVDVKIPDPTIRTALIG